MPRAGKKRYIVENNTDLVNWNIDRIKQGLPPLANGGPRTHAMRITEAAFKGLETIAQDYHHVWGLHGNVTEFIEALGEGYYEVILRQPSELYYEVHGQWPPDYSGPK